MKTTIRTILCTAIFAVLAVSCQKSIDSENPVEPTNSTERGNGTIDISVNGLMGEYSQQDGVKSSLVKKVRVAWAAGDVVYVFDGSKYLGKLTAALDKKADGTDEDRYAKLGGTISAPATTPCVLSLVHSSLMTEPETGAAVSELSIDMSAQSTATVPFVAYATLEYTGTTITDVVVPFQFATSVIKVNCTGLKPGTAITSATLSNVNTECKLTLFGDKAPVVAGGTNGTITRTGDAYFAADKVNEEGVAVFQIAAPKLGEASEVRVLTIAQGSDEFEYKNFSKKALSAATSVNTVCQLVKALPAGALPGVFTVDDNGTPEDTSDDVKVHFSQGNLTYDVYATTNKWKFYEHQYDCAANGDASSTLISLFTWGYDADKSIVPDGSAIDNVNITSGNLSQEQDWGSQIGDGNTWRTLSNAEWQYLFNTRTMEKSGARSENLTSSGITVEDVLFKGVVLFPDNFTNQADWKTKYTTWKALNDAGIVFLPAAGSRDGSDVSGVGNDGYYWSSTGFISTFASRVYFDSDDVSPGLDVDRYLGCSVRLITESK